MINRQTVRINRAMENLNLYTPIPDYMFYDDDYKFVKNDVKLLYGYLVKKLLNNAKAVFYDENNDKYLIADNTELSLFLNVSVGSLNTYKKALEKVGLLEQKQEFRKPNRLYVHIPADEVQNTFEQFNESLKEKRKENRQKDREKREKEKAIPRESILVMETPENEKKEPQTLGTTKPYKICKVKHCKICKVKHYKNCNLYINNKIYINNKDNNNNKDLKNLKSFKTQQQKDNYITLENHQEKLEILKTEVPEPIATNTIKFLAQRDLLGQATPKAILLGAIKAMAVLKVSPKDVPHTFIAKYIENEIGAAALPAQPTTEQQQPQEHEEPKINIAQAFKEYLEA